MTQQRLHDIQLENLSLQTNGKPQNEFQNTNHSHDTQITAHTFDSNSLLVPTRVFIEQQTQHLTQPSTKI